MNTTSFYPSAWFDGEEKVTTYVEEDPPLNMLPLQGSPTIDPFWSLAVERFAFNPCPRLFWLEWE